MNRHLPAYFERQPWPSPTPEQTGEEKAAQMLRDAKRASEAQAAAILAAHECPADLVEWGKRHNIPNFAEVTWQAGFRAGMQMAMLAREGER